MTEDRNVPDVVREAEAILAGADDPNSTRVRQLVQEGFSYVAISGFDVVDDEQREHVTPAVQIIAEAFKGNPEHAIMLQAATTAFLLLLAPTLDAKEAATRLADVRDKIEEAYPDDDGPTIGLRLPPPPE